MIELFKSWRNCRNCGKKTPTLDYLSETCENCAKEAESRSLETLTHNPDGSITFHLYHGTLSGRLPTDQQQLRLGGFHAGTQKSAIVRMKALTEGAKFLQSQMEKMSEERRKEYTRAARDLMIHHPQLFPVDITLRKPYGSIELPIGETVLDCEILDPFDPNCKTSLPRLREQGYDGIIYKNRIEDPGSLSVLAFSMNSVRPRLTNKLKVPSTTRFKPKATKTIHAGIKQ